MVVCRGSLTSVAPLGLSTYKKMWFSLQENHLFYYTRKFSRLEAGKGSSMRSTYHYLVVLLTTVQDMSQRALFPWIASFKLLQKVHRAFPSTLAVCCVNISSFPGKKKFLIVLKERTFELGCESTEMRDNWVFRLATLLHVDSNIVTKYLH